MARRHSFQLETERLTIRTHPHLRRFRFYEPLGFEPTGVVYDGEVEAQLDLGKPAD